MTQEHMNVEERQALGSTPFTLTVSIPYSPVIRHFDIISLHHNTNTMQCLLVLNCFVIDAIFEYILPYDCDPKPNNNIFNTDRYC